MLVRLYATLRDLVGTASINLKLDGPTTAGQVLERLADSYPALRAKLVDAEGSPSAYVQTLLNGRRVQFLQGPQTPVSDDDVISLFPPVGGG